MFDLEYYNEITDYGVIYNNLLEGRRMLYKTHIDKKRREEYRIYTEKTLRDLVIFDKRHTPDYGKWFCNYNNKIPIKSLNQTWTDEYNINTINRLNAF